MKSKRRYTSEKQILDRIDRQRALLAKHLSAACELDAEADKLRDEQDGSKIGFINDLRSRAKKKRRRAWLLEHNHLPALGQKLSEFRTEVMPDITMDRSAQA